MLISSSASTTASYLQLSNNLSRSQTLTADEPTVKNATSYYLANVGKMTTASQFVNNYQVFSYAMKAYGLSDMTYAKAFMTKVLAGGPSGFASTLSDPRYKAFATAFDFADKGATATQQTSATTDTTSAYVQQQLESEAGQTNQGVQLALYFSRKASSVTSAYSILADTSLLKVVETTYGLSSYFGDEDVDTQANYIKHLVNIADFQDPKKVSQMVERFTAMWDVSGSNTVAPSITTSSLFTDTTGSIGISSDTLLSLSNLRLGG